MAALNNIIMFLFFMFIVILSCSLGYSQLSAPPQQLHTVKSPPSLDPVLLCGGHLPLPITGFWNLELIILITVNKQLFGSLGIKSELLF